eukprot:365377-Chlamydomonas_euryale.AAC.1
MHAVDAVFGAFASITKQVRGARVGRVAASRLHQAEARASRPSPPPPFKEQTNNGRWTGGRAGGWMDWGTG